MDRIQYYVCNLATGEVLRNGSCSPDMLDIQAHEPGTVARAGLGDPTADRVDGNGAVQAPVDDIPHVKSSATTVSGLPTPTTVTFGGQDSIYRVRQGTWVNFFSETKVFKFSSPGYRSVSVELQGENVDLDESIF